MTGHDAACATGKGRAVTRNLDERLTTYERSVVDDVRRWLDREPGWPDRLLMGVSSTSRQALEVVLETGPGRRVLKVATQRALEAVEGPLLGDLYDDAPIEVYLEAERRESALRSADDRARQLRDVYVGALGAQGALTGAASLSWARSAMALAADVGVALLATLRAAAHNLSVYGALTSHPSGVEAAIELVAAASETDPEVRRPTILALTRRLAEQHGSGDLEEELPRVLMQQTSSRAVTETVEQVVRRLLHRRLAGLVPVLGAVAGGAASGWLAAQVCEAARHVGRVAFLERHTGIRLEDLLGIERLPAASG